MTATPAPRVEQIEPLHGVRVRDPYRALERMEAAEGWIVAQNARARAWLKAHRDPAAAERLDTLLRVGSVGSPSFAGPNVFYRRKDGDREQDVLYVQVDGAPPRALIDPNQLSEQGRIALDWYAPSRDGALVAYGTSKDGDEWSTLRVLEVASGRHRADEIPLTRAASIAWLPDGSGFYYTRYPAPTGYDRHLYFHTLGGDPAADPLVMGKERLPDRTDWPSATLSDDGRYLLVTRWESWSKSTLHLLDRRTGAWQALPSPGEGLFADAEVVGGHVWAISSHGHPMSRLVRIDPAHPEPERWQQIIAEDPAAPLQSMGLVEGGIVTLHLQDAAARLTWWSRDGQSSRPVPLPVPGSVGGVHTQHDDRRLLFSFQSFFYPPALFLAKAPGLQPEALVRTEADIDTGAFTVDQVQYRSYDGTLVPMFVIHRKGIELDGGHPTLLNGYGGFNVSVGPAFMRNVIFWLEQGGVYAVANLRGGGERGEAWHQAGILERKFQVFADFEYAMRYLHREGYTRPDRLGIIGGSNGGLLMGAMLTQAPHLFAATVTKVGLYDMLRYHRFPPAELWIDEYGDPDDPARTGYLWAYSPYHQIIDGVRYPAVLAMTADHDSRVHWSHTAKFVAALQHAQAGDAPILLRFERKAGHGAGKGTSKVVEEYVDQYAFLMATLGLGAAGP